MKSCNNQDRAVSCLAVQSSATILTVQLVQSCHTMAQHVFSTPSNMCDDWQPCFEVMKRMHRYVSGTRSYCEVLQA